MADVDGGDRAGAHVVNRAPDRTPRRDDGGLRPATIGWAFALALSVGYLIQRLLNDHIGRMPFPGWYGAVLPVLLCVLIDIAGLPIRRWRAGRLRRRLDPLRAFRTLLLARAAALAGGLVAGWYLAQALVLVPDAESAVVLRGIQWCLAYVAAGLSMIGCGLLVQSWCRLDPPDDSHKSYERYDADDGDAPYDDGPYEPR